MTKHIPPPKGSICNTVYIPKGTACKVILEGITGSIEVFKHDGHIEIEILDDSLKCQGGK